MRTLLVVVGLSLTSFGLAEGAELDLVYSGGLRGFSRTSARFELQDRMGPALEAAGVDVGEVEVLHGLLAQDDLELWPESGTLAAALAFAKSADRACDHGVLVDTWRTPTERFLPGPAGDDLSPQLPVPDGIRQSRRLHRCEGGGVVVNALVEPHAPAPDARPLDAFDIRTGFRWLTPVGTYLQLGHPRREPGRRLGVLRKALTAPGSRFVDSGDFLEGGQWAEDTLVADSRVIGFEVLESLAPLALAPGVSELALGPAALAAEARARSLPYVATNWQQEGEASFPRVLRVSVPSGEETVDIAFLGVTDPTFATGLPTELLEGLTLVDPVSSVQAEVDALRASPTPPQLVVLLVQPSAELQQRLRSVLYGVDLMLGDPTAATFRVASSEVRFRNVGGAFKAAPITLPLDGIAAATVTLGEAPERVVVRPLEVSSTSPMDRELTATLSELHAREDVELGKPLIPPDEPLAGVSEARWTKLVCEALLQRTGADAAFLDGLAFHRPTPGPLTERQVVDRLRGGHIVEVHRIDGNRLAALLPAADGMTPVRCGAPTNTFFPRVHGRFVDPNRTYRIATTDVTRRGPLGPLLSRGSSELIGHQPKFRAVQTDDGPLTLATAVLETLEEAAEDEDWVTSWLDRTPNQWRPQLLLNIRRLGLHITWFEGARTDRYEAVPESLLNSPSSFTLGGGADIALEGSSAKLLADLRFTANYVRFVIAGLPPQEVADDWVLSTSLEAPVLGTPYARWFQVRPFVQASLDSEFTPFVADNGTELPQQADLSAFGGIAFSPGPWLRSFRLGPFVNRDLGRLTDKGTEFGARLTGATRHLLPPRAVILVSTAWDVQVFADTPQDDAADLRLRAWGEVRGSVRLVRALSLGIFAQGLLVQGRVPQTSTPAGSITVGASFDLSTAVRLDVRPRVFP